MSAHRRGIWLMILACLALAIQDGISRQLAGQYNVLMVVMIRYWFFAAFVIARAAKASGGLRRAAQSARPKLQIFRALLLIAEICIAILGFVKLGLVASQAIFACYPILTTALAWPMLGERITKANWRAVLIGALGVLILIGPGQEAVSIWALLPLASAALFALYSVLTRRAAHHDSAETSLFWTACIGALAITPLGLWSWTPMPSHDWAWMAALCLTALIAHDLLIRAYAAAMASAVQPFAYFQLVFAAAIGVVFFGEAITVQILIGAAIVVASGLLSLRKSAP